MKRALALFFFLNYDRLLKINHFRCLGDTIAKKTITGVFWLPQGAFLCVSDITNKEEYYETSISFGRL